ncbi:MAG: hypothetical protein H7327_14165, partial [Herminiimonas sp.]|nr:hypothetical protein [Herminiimonas sp.]
MHSNPNGIAAQQGVSSGQTSASSENTGHPRISRRGNHALGEITAQSSEKQKRRAVKAIAADYEKLQLAGIGGIDNGSISASRNRHIEALTSTQTKLAQIVATGLSEQVPQFSFSRSAKNSLALAGGVASKTGQIIAASAVVAGTGAVAAAVTPVAVFSGLFSIFGGIVLCTNPCAKDRFDRFFYIAGAETITFPFRATYQFLRSDCVVNALGSINAYPRAAAYATRQRLPTAFIAAITATQIAEELSRFYRDTLTEEERVVIDAQASINGRNGRPSAAQATGRQFSAATGMPAYVSGPVQQTGWHFPEIEENAAAFNAFQARITATAEYRNALSKPGIVHRVDILVDAMRASPALRATCFAIASDSIQSCGDRVALGLNDMEQALISEKAESGKLSTGELFYTGLGCFKKQILDEIALAKIGELKRRGTAADEVEIRLAYPTELRDRLALPGVTQSMQYRASAKVTVPEIASAEKTVRQKLKNGEGANFLAQWQPWCKAMENANTDAFRKLKDAIQVKRDGISIMPAHMTEQQWLTALEQQKTDEKTQFTDLVKR